MQQEFVHLHCHSEFSPDGMGRIEDLIHHVAELGQKALAITDHGVLGSIVQHYLNCKKNNIKPIFGCEFYLRYLPDKTNHITILAKNKLGFDNLIELSNAAWNNQQRGRPCITTDMMQEYNNGLIVLTGCPSSALFMNEYNDGYTYAETLVKLFGRTNVFAELMFTMDDKALYYNRALSIANELDIKPVITNDCHFVKKEHSALHPKLTVARKGFDYSSSTLYVMNSQEIYDTAINYGANNDIVLAAMQTSVDIADSVENIEIESEPQLPHVSASEFNQLKQHLLHKLELDCAGKADAEIRKARFAVEYDVFESMKFLDYLYIVYDLAEFCAREKMFISLRGSGGGCYLIYLLGIADVDPIQYDLLFERFLNISRDGYPDVDLDIETLQRKAVLDYLNQKWGMVGVATYSRYGHKSLIHDIFRVFDIDENALGVSNIEAKICEYESNESEAYTSLITMYPEIDTFYNIVHNQIRQSGKHAGAVCSALNTTIKLPMENGIVALTEGNDKELTRIGIVKLDMLGIRELDRQRAMYNLTGVLPPKNPEDYLPEVFINTFQVGKTLNFFQVDASSGIRDLTRAINPTNYNDIVAAISLYRPGALDAGTAQIYAELKKNGQRKIHPEIDKILAPTFGVIVYQEQVMAIYALITNTGLLGADTARRILSPKSVKKLLDPKWIAEKDAVHLEFTTKGTENGWNSHLLDELWNELLTHTRYSFNKSHAAAYAFHALKDAWYLYYYPVQYYTALLQIDVHNNNEDAQKILYYAAKDGINIHLPDINLSTDTYTSTDNSLYLPLQAIYRLGDNGVKHLIETRELLEHKKFTTISDLKRLDGRKVNKSALRRLYQIGGLDVPELNKFVDLSVIPENASFEDLQFDAMQFIIPNEWILRMIEESMTKQFSIIGFINSSKAKKTKNGYPYISYKLHPVGNFWTYVNKNTTVIADGTLVGVKFKVKNNTHFGLAEEVIRFPLNEAEFKKYLKDKRSYKLV